MAQFSSYEPIWRPIEMLHKIMQGTNESLWEYISWFTQAMLIVTNFNDQTERSAFVSNIHPNKQYKYLIGYQNMQSFNTS